MSNSLWSVAQEYRSQAEQLMSLDLDEQTLADTLEGLSGEVEQKALSVAHVVRALEAEADAVKAWSKQAADRAKAIAARAERLEEYLSAQLRACGIQKVQGNGVTVSFRASKAVDVFEPGLIPAEFMRVKPAPEPEPDKTAIAAALKGGVDVPGARLESRESIQIR